MSPKLLISMLDNKREIDCAKIRRLAFQTGGAVWGKDVFDESTKVVESPFD